MNTHRKLKIEPLSFIVLKPHKYDPKDARTMYAKHNTGRFHMKALQRSYPVVSLAKARRFTVKAKCIGKKKKGIQIKNRNCVLMGSIGTITWHCYPI